MQSSSLALDLWSLATKGTQELLRRSPFSHAFACKVSDNFAEKQNFDAFSTLL